MAVARVIVFISHGSMNESWSLPNQPAVMSSNMMRWRLPIDSELMSYGLSLSLSSPLARAVMPSRRRASSP